jgi:hypothetical protein
MPPDAFSRGKLRDKIVAICMHGILSAKGFCPAERFRQVFMIVLALSR